MILLSYLYRFASNFVFLALVYFSLNFLERYPHRAIVAILVLVYSTMYAVSALRSFYFFQRIERLEVEASRLAPAAAEGPSSSASRKQSVGAAPCRRGQVVYRLAVPRARHPAVHRQDRDELTAATSSSVQLLALQLAFFARTGIRFARTR